MNPRRLLPALAVLALISASITLRAATAPSTAQARPTNVIPFLSRNNHILVRGTVGDSDSLWFVLDTGASGNVLNASTAKRLGLKVVPGVSAHGAGGREQGGTVERSTIRLPGVGMDDSLIVALPLDVLALRSGHPCDGIIGVPFWRGSVVEIDYARSELTLHDPKTYRYEGAGKAFRLTFEHGLPYMEAKATLPGRKPIEGRFVLDTGSSMSLILAPPFVARTRALETQPRTLQMLLGGVGGRSTSPLGRIERLELGPYAIDRPLAVLRQSGPGQISALAGAGNIGGEILRRFRVIFDYSRKRMVLEPAAGFGEPFETDMSGILLSPRDDGSGAVEVAIVQDDSPAQDLGIRPGDVLVTFEGRPVVPAELLDVRRELRQEGRSVRLGLERDGVVTERTLVTRRLL